MGVSSVYQPAIPRGGSLAAYQPRANAAAPVGDGEGYPIFSKMLTDL